MVRKILVGIDGSKSSQKAAAFAVDLARQTKAGLVLTMVLRPPHALPFMPMEGYVVTSMGTTPEEEQRSHALLERVASELNGLDVKRRVEFGEPAELLVKVAEEEKVDLLIVGARGLGAASRWMMGSVSDRVAHHACCAVTVVR